MSVSFSEGRARSAAKAVSWRLLGSADTLALSYVLTGNLTVAGSIAGVESITKSVLYYLHERAWGLVSWKTNAAAPGLPAGHLAPPRRRGTSRKRRRAVGTSSTSR